MGFNQTAFFVSLATVVIITGTIIYQKKKKRTLPSTWEEIGTLTKLRLYPLKCGHRWELDRAECTEVGIRQIKENNNFQLRDRSFVVYSQKDHKYGYGGTHPKMLLIDVDVYDENHIAINAPTMTTLYVKIPTKTDDNECTIKLLQGEEIFTIDCGDEAGSWFSKYILGEDSGLRLGYHDASRRRDLTKAHKTLLDYYKNMSNISAGLYSNYTSTMLINQASINDLNKRIGNLDITVERFRPNFVVDGPKLEPYVEDTWEWVKIGDVILRNVKECTRCILTTVDPENGIRNSGREPLKTLETYRKSKGPSKAGVMGIHMEVRKTGSISVGDPVYVARS